MKLLKRFFRWLGLLLLLFLVYVAAVLIHGTMTDFQPEAELALPSTQKAEQEVIEDSVLSFVTWNIGYCGLGARSDFFYDTGGMLYSGGKMVRSSKDLVVDYLNGAKSFLRSNQADFYLFQEVDWDSKRSYGLNQFELLGAELPGFSGWFAVNYLSPRVPIPILEPWKAYGRTNSGLATFAWYEAEESTRYQLPGDYPWPTRIFQLDRCAAVHRFALANGKELVVVNVHNSAYDKGGVLKKQQMAFLKTFLLGEYREGNYVVVGGDWNQCPPYFQFDTFSPGETAGYEQLNIEADYLPDNWRWVYDPQTPTNRKVSEIYDPASTFTTLIDFFLISPNVQVLKVRGINQGFQYSDHQPVWMEVQLKD
ncbi:MAG: endonuclease/exonuclease/phosphatase family protein [Phaeodactylibacter sp.]|nr:endonuclease/exonuclease/phosphatase family protein [Phaeodactylibacter sp.]